MRERTAAEVVIGIHARLARARVIRDDLRVAITDERKGIVARNHLRWALDRKSSALVISAAGNIAVSDDIALKLGEYAHHLRAALDHTISALVLRENKQLNASRQFPVCYKASEFRKSARKRWLDGVPDWAINYVESIQPYHGIQDGLNALHALSEINNMDKHRTLVVLAAAVYNNELTLLSGPDPLPDFILPEPSKYSSIKPMTEAGVEVFRFGLRPFSSDLVIEVGGDSILCIDISGHGFCDINRIVDFLDQTIPEVVLDLLGRK